MSTPRHSAAASLPEAAAPQSSPWLTWLDVPEATASTESVLEWLERLRAQLPSHAAACQEDELRLAALWRHMVPKLGEFLPDEVGHVVSAQLEAAARRGAADALVEMVRVEHDRLSSANPLADVAEAGPAVDPETLRRLLDGIANDRATTGRAAIAEALETLCSMALELELTERRLESGSVPSETLADLRSHVTEAASTLRSLPNKAQVRQQEDEDLDIAVRRCVDRYAGSLDTSLEWTGSGVTGEATADAVVWVLQELLHRLHGAFAGIVTIAVDTTDGVVMRLTSPSTAFAASGAEPDWMLRCRLRLQLAGGEIRSVPLDDGSCVEVSLT